MGYYINPQSGTKEAWLNANGKKVGAIPPIERTPNTHLVCLVDNGVFTAAGIAFDKGEQAAFAGNDGRHKTWYEVPDELLEPFCKGISELPW